MRKFVIRQVPTGFKFDLRAENGQTVASSEVYSARSGCLRGIEAVRRCAARSRVADLTEENAVLPSNPRLELYQDKREDYRFRLRARNGEIIAVSESYSSRSACLSGLESVLANAPTAEIE